MSSHHESPPERHPRFLPRRTRLHLRGSRPCLLRSMSLRQGMQRVLHPRYPVQRTHPWTQRCSPHPLRWGDLRPRKCLPAPLKPITDDGGARHGTWSHGHLTSAEGPMEHDAIRKPSRWATNRWRATSRSRPRRSGRRNSACSIAMGCPARCASSISAAAPAKSRGASRTLSAGAPARHRHSRRQSRARAPRSRHVGDRIRYEPATRSRWARRRQLRPGRVPAHVAGRAGFRARARRNHPRAQARRLAAPAVGGLRHAAHAARRRCLRSRPLLDRHALPFAKHRLRRPHRRHSPPLLERRLHRHRGGLRHRRHAARSAGDLRRHPRRGATATSNRSRLPAGGRPAVAISTR